MSTQTEPETHADPAWLRIGAVPVSFLVGALVTVQSKLNSDLGSHLGHGPRAGLLAAVISFVTGLVILTALLVAIPSWRRDLVRLRAATRTSGLPRWQLFGGVLGALLVASQATTVATIGVAVFIVAVVAGQTTSALAVDHIGLSPSGRQPVNAARILGAGLAVVAVAVSSGGAFSGSNGTGILLLALLPLVAGAGVSVQQAVNARVATTSSPWVATWNNFVVGTTALVLAFAVTLLLPGSLHGLPGNLWLYAGGPIGVAFIATGALVVRTIGVLIFGLCSVAGQVVSAIVVDLVLDPSQVTTATYVGAALTLLGVGVAGVAQLRARRRA